jgi:microsomal dipeptidase-like Zn-dependent dipeptidase
LVGIDHVGLGSDFDGVGDSLPTGLKDVSMFPNLIAELLKRGYSKSDIEKICHKNIFGFGIRLLLLPIDGFEDIGKSPLLKNR